MIEENENEGIIGTLSRTIEQNWRLLLVGVIILAIALNSSWSNSESSEENKATPTPQATEQSSQNEQAQQAENTPTEQAQNNENNSNNTAQAKEPETTNTVSNGNSIVQVAARSEGVTHLARRAVKEYLASNQENLSAEQKIYAEDYLKKKIGSKLLEVGEKIEFSNDIIKQGIEQAKGLNEKQIENLSKYVPLVKNLN